MKNNRKFTRSEKKLFVVTGLAVALILGFGAWWQWVNEVPDIEIPTPEMPSPNAYDFYVKVGTAIIPANPAVDPIDDFNVVPESQWKTHYPTARKAAWVRQNAEALSLLRQGFKYPCRVPLRPEAPSLSLSLRSMGRLLVVESRVHSERGNWGRAAESTLDGFELGHDVAQGGGLRDFYASVAVNAIMRSELWKILPHLNATEAKAATRRLEESIQTLVPYADVLEGIKISHQAEMLAFMRSSRWGTDIEVLLDMDRYTGVERTIQRWRMVNTPRRVIFNNYTNYMDDLIADAKKPYTAQSPLPPFPNDFYTQIVAASSERILWNYPRQEAGNSLLLVSLALRAHKLEHNRYPKTLNELVPRYLTKIPADPYGGGEDLRYKLRGAEFSLYSIGPDGIDNGGRAIEDAKIPKEKPGRFLVRPESTGDMVAGIN